MEIAFLRFVPPNDIRLALLLHTRKHSPLLTHTYSPLQQPFPQRCMTEISQPTWKSAVVLQSEARLLEHQEDAQNSPCAGEAPAPNASRTLQPG